ncbi:toxin-antitoxin system HicB family antitoxin [Candidatus Woesearchaeota archaeon]|nr:toxin-antitoxin system HicB family antitoxin [Candidatus Woesearchaeota archaeon]
MGKKKRVNIGLSEELHTKAKVIAVLKGITLNEYLEQAISKALAKEKELLKRIK